MDFRISFAILLLLPFWAMAGENNKCLIRGTCGPNPDGSTDTLIGQPNCLNCKLKEPEDPQEIDDEAIDMLYQTCPHLREQLGPNPQVCCTKRQIEIMQKSFGQAVDLLARCPVCYANWIKNFCATTCMPGNVEFIQISRNETNPSLELVHNATQAPCGGFDVGPNGAYNTSDPGKT